MTGDKLQGERKNNKKNLLIAARHQSPAACYGFTLLELIVVIFIVSLVLAISLPSFTGMGEGRAESDAKRLAAMIRHLNDTAMSARNNIYMKIAFGDKVINYETSDGKRSEKFECLAGMETQARGVVSEGEVVIFFGPSGASESFKVYLKDGKNTITVALNSLSGRVKITSDEKSNI